MRSCNRSSTSFCFLSSDSFWFLFFSSSFFISLSPASSMFRRTSWLLCSVIVCIVCIILFSKRFCMSEVHCRCCSSMCSSAISLWTNASSLFCCLSASLLVSSSSFLRLSASSLLSRCSNFSSSSFRTSAVLLFHSSRMCRNSTSVFCFQISSSLDVQFSLTFCNITSVLRFQMPSNWDFHRPIFSVHSDCIAFWNVSSVSFCRWETQRAAAACMR
mmetsp:Transcript_35755/g.93209  ORF Transcript_35755/g.93209 Transcript_35755/m.93209 type:complete len:216 (-) Transcript_35755:175-822(-)